MSASNVDYLAMRKAMADSETSTVASLGPPPADIGEFYHDISLPSGHSTKVKVFRPMSIAAATPGRPLIVLFHGGGFIVGSMEMHTRPGRDFARAYGAVVVSAGYRLAPEHLFPASVQDAVETTRWMAEFAGDVFGADLNTGFVVGGSSAGAQAAAVAASEARQKAVWGDLPQPTALFLSIPALLVEEIVPAKYKAMYTSHTQSCGPTTPEMLQAARDIAQADVRSPLFSPFNSPLGLKGLPKSYVQVGNADPLRDDGLVFVQALRDVGGEVKCYGYDGLGHEGWTIWWNEEREPKSLIGDSMKGMGWLLGKNE